MRESRCWPLPETSAAGEPLGYVHPHLASLPGEVVTAEEAAGVKADVCFSCLPGGHLAKHLDDLETELVIDLADDFRAETGWTYGLTEFAAWGGGGDESHR